MITSNKSPLSKDRKNNQKTNRKYCVAHLLAKLAIMLLAFTEGNSNWPYPKQKWLSRKTKEAIPRRTEHGETQRHSHQQDTPNTLQVRTTELAETRKLSATP